MVLCIIALSLIQRISPIPQMKQRKIKIYMSQQLMHYQLLSKIRERPASLTDPS